MFKESMFQTLALGEIWARDSSLLGPKKSIKQCFKRDF